MHFHMMVRPRFMLVTCSHNDRSRKTTFITISARARIKICTKLLNIANSQWFKAKSLSTDVSVILMHSENSVFSGPWTHISHLYGACWVINIKKWKEPSLDKVYLLERYGGREEDDEILLGLLLCLYDLFSPSFIVGIWSLFLFACLLHWLIFRIGII